VSVQIIKEGKRYEDLTEVAKLFNLYGADKIEEETDDTEAQPAAA